MAAIKITEWTTVEGATGSDDVTNSKHRRVVVESQYGPLTVDGLLDFADGLRQSGIAGSASVQVQNMDGRPVRLSATREHRIEPSAVDGAP